MGRLILTRGLPGSGKSTWATEWVRMDPDNRVRINRDDIRAMLGITTGIGTPTQEAQVSAIEKASAKAALETGADVVIDATNLNPRFVREWFKIGRVEFKDFPVAIDGCVLRDGFRHKYGGRGVGEPVIRAIAKRAKVQEDGTLPAPPKQPEPFVFTHIDERPASPQRERAIIVDIDGTVADMAGHRGPYDTSKYDLDEPHRDVIEIVNALKSDGDDGTYMDVIFVSGRDTKFRQVTLNWLSAHGIYYPRLYMRPEGDTRNDAIVKHDLYYEHIHDAWRVVGVFDDRARVLRMWRQIGLTTFAVGDTENNDF